MPRSGGKRKWKSPNKADHGYHPKPHGLSSKPLSEYAPSVQTEVQQLFLKKFSFQKPTKGQVWALPPASSLFTAPAIKDWDADMNKHKAELNELKCELSDKDIRDWHRHTSFTHRSALVIQHLKYNYWAELCTQAWCKFHELISSYDVIQPGLVSKAQTPFNTVHLCEAPGAFVTSLNHFLKSHDRWKNLAWRWLATTLNPYYEGNSMDSMIADDRFILPTQTNWFFGVDNTGNLMDLANLMSLKQKVESTMATVHLYIQGLMGDKDRNLDEKALTRLADEKVEWRNYVFACLAANVTADGSINCQNDPAEQEIVVSQLHYCEVVTALMLLAPGGSFILKMFTLFEHQTACLMYLLNCTFQQVHVCKPATSKAGNSEVYVTCLGFIGCQYLQEYMPRLLQQFGVKDCHQALFGAADIPSSFLDQLHSCCASFKDYQMAAISENMWLYPHMSEKEQQRLTAVRECCCQAFVQQYAITTIRKADKISPDSSKGQHIQGGSSMFAKVASKRLHGTFTERQQLDHAPWIQRLNGDYKMLAPTTQESEVFTQSLQSKCELMPASMNSWELTVGKELKSIQSSAFCTAEVLDDWNLAMMHAYVGCKESEQASNYDDAIVGEVLANLIKLHKISKSQSDSIKCMYLHWGAAQTNSSFVHLANATGHLEILDYSMQPDTAVTEKGIEATPPDRKDQTFTASSDFRDTHLVDSTALARWCETLQDSKVPVIYSDCSLARTKLSPTKPYLSELDTRHRFLISALIALHALHIGGMWIVHIPAILTRFSAGLLYMIHKAFHQVTLMAENDKGYRSICVIAQEFHGIHHSLIKHLLDVHTAVVQSLSSNEMEVLQFVPQSNLCERDFNIALSSFNDKFLSGQTRYCVHRELTLQLGDDQPAVCQGQTG